MEDIKKRLQELESKLKELEEHNKRLLDQAVVDPYTGLLNKTEIENRLNGELERARRENGSLILLFFDIDNFKKINTVFGQKGGDQVISEVSDLIKQTFREYDLLGRYGGEEFLVGLPGATIWEGYRIAERLRKTIEEFTLNADGRKTNITISIGISSSRDLELLKREVPSNRKNRDFELLIKLANNAETAAKKDGKNRTYINLCGALLEGSAIRRIMKDEDMVAIIEKARKGLVEVTYSESIVPISSFITGVREVKRGKAKQGDFYIETKGHSSTVFTGFVTGNYNGENNYQKNIVQDTGMQIIAQMKETGLTRIPNPEKQLWIAKPGKINFLNLKLNDEFESGMLKWEFAKRIIDQASENGERRGIILNITGTKVLEQLIFRKTKKIIKYAKERGMFVVLTVDDIPRKKQTAQELVFSGINSLSVNLSKGDYRESLRKVFHGLVHIAEFREHSELEKIILNASITNLNYYELTDFVQWVGEIKEGEGLTFFDDINPVPIKEEPQSYLDVEELRDFNDSVVPRISYLAKRYNLKLLGTKIMEIFGAQLTEKSAMDERVFLASEGIYYGMEDMFCLSCPTALTSATIDPKGDVYACSYHREAPEGADGRILLGNIKDSDLSEMRNNYFQVLSKLPRGNARCQRFCGPDMKKVNRGVKRYLRRSGVL